MSTASNEPQYGPLGPGQTPVKDPLKGLGGVCAAALSMEAITMGLVLTVIGRIDNGIYWTSFNWIYVTVLAVVLFLLAFLQRFSWALPAALICQVFALGGFFIHPSMGVVAIVYILVWWYILHLRSRLLARMKMGLLTTQHM
ncbi:DUF4233 domain-containing protein [Corynebacterium caspium]|uniref:DUF4233 domain-containing protein n=1 Tax=Corynebacterium caspium TaxID=234828 RepID=UPI00036CED14|nr:DUF4233 domain-containing protein [Corynebacterium caspium]WKD58841.1 hypothetical protein CCASP_02165 [Corynebacterium caspium DSM 44850]